MTTITLDSRPRLAAKARLRWDRRGERYMLLYPERGLVLNATAADVVRLCTGEHTVGAIIEQLVAKYASQPREAIEQEVRLFLTRMAERALLRGDND
jgi:pyrroloquinoline quinone biosynthesis protein D